MLKILLAAYVLTLLLGLRLKIAAVCSLSAALVLNIAMIAVMWVTAGRPPFKTLYETMILYPACVSAVTLILVAGYRVWILIPCSAAICAGGLVYALLRPDMETINLPPALQSAWFVPHVVTYFVAYAALFASFALALLSLAGRPHEENAHRAAKFGFAALTIGLILGAVWGKSAWGDYWAWDPKENWALATFLAYLIYFHLRLMRAWQGRRAMVVLAFSFVAVVFTYVGISLLPQSAGSLHVYS